MANNPDDKDDYDIGYGKPPKDTQFKKGQSGNPKGRPKGTKNFKTDLKEELAEQVLISEDGKRRPVSKQRALIKRVTQKGLVGDIRAIGMLAGWVFQLLDIGSDEADSDELSPDDEAILQRFLSDSSNDNVDSDQGET